jgi:hypothetical protein
MPQNRAMLAVPTDVADALSGLALSQSTNSLSEFGGRFLRATIQYGTLGSSATGERSASMSNCNG